MQHERCPCKEELWDDIDDENCEGTRGFVLLWVGSSFLRVAGDVLCCSN